MGRGRKLETFDDFKRALKNKYGLGEGHTYKPWLRVQDVKSQGVRSQIWGRKTKREHHMLSSIESEFFYLAEFCDSVIDIREQFPLLPLNISQKIASLIDVKHPTIPVTNTPNIITTDFLLTMEVQGKTVYKAISIKPERESNKQRVLEKIDIERVWWELLGVQFQYFTGNELTRIQSRNISWVTAPFRSAQSKFTDAQSRHALSLLRQEKYLIVDICSIFVDEIAIEPEDAQNLLRYLIAEKLLTVDMSYSIEESGFIDVIDIDFEQRLVANGYS